MSILPPDQSRAMRAVAAGKTSARPTLAHRWEELHTQAAELARLAELSPEPFKPVPTWFSVRSGDSRKDKHQLAWQALEDIDAIMQPGMVALRAIAARGQDVTAPALALWREFYAARSAVLAIVEADPATQEVAAA